MIRWFAGHPTAANLLLLLFLAAGTFAAPGLLRETFPDFRAVEAEVIVPYRGAAAEDVESAICAPLWDGVQGVEGLETFTCTAQIGRARAHAIPVDADVKPGDQVKLRIDHRRRRPIEAHHTATHLLQWALHEVVSSDVAQQGSAVDEERLRFDFNSGAVSREQIKRIEEMAVSGVAWAVITMTCCDGSAARAASNTSRPDLPGI